MKNDRKESEICDLRSQKPEAHKRHSGKTRSIRKSKFFWNYYHAERMQESYQKFLVYNPPKMPRKFLPRFIENEPTTETEIRQQLAVEKFKNEIGLLQLCSRRYEQRFKNLDSEMVAHITSKFREEISARIIEQWEEACTKEESKSIKIYRRLN